MSNWPVFLTAPNVDLKAVNKAWIFLQDFEFTKPEDDGSWVLITSTKVLEASPKPTRMLNLTTESLSNHDMAGFTMADVGTWVQESEEQIKQLDITPYQWVIFDQQALDQHECIFVRRRYDAKKKKVGHNLQAVRIPCTETWSMFANLEIANMGFKEWVDEDAGVDGDGIYKWIGPFPNTNESSAQAFEKTAREVKAKREVLLKTAKDLGHID